MLTLDGTTRCTLQPISPYSVMKEVVYDGLNIASMDTAQLANPNSLMACSLILDDPGIVFATPNEDC